MRAHSDSDGSVDVPDQARLERRNGLLVAVTDAPGLVSASEVREVIEAVRGEQLELAMAAIDPKAARG